MRVAIIGAGAAGLCAAVTLASKGVQVHLYEQNDQIGKKIVASGNGKCNISNAQIDACCYYGENPQFAHRCLQKFDAKTFWNFFTKMGLFMVEKGEGKIYPYSSESKAVTRVFDKALEHSKVTLFLNSKVEKIETENEKFIVYTPLSERTKSYDALLLAMGSQAAPMLGGCHDGYRFAETFGHRTLATYPALVQLELQSTQHYKMAGVKMVATVTLYVDGKNVDMITGDILFTRYGISGFAILDISHSASKALIENRKVFIGLDLLPELNAQSLVASLGKLSEQYESISVENLLGGLLPAKVIEPILKSCAIDSNQPVTTLNQKQFKRIVNQMKSWRFDVVDTHGFKHAEVSGGGISTDEVDEHTMESMLQRNLYIAGEMLDITGKRGGYNLHFAWASGYCAAMGMINK